MVGVINDRGVPVRKASPSRFPLQLRALFTGLAGFPLQSLTRNTVRTIILLLALSSKPLCAQEIDLRAYDYSKIDSVTRALQAPPNIPSSELAALLTRGLSSDHERFRAIFIWIANNIEYRWGSYGSDPDRILKRKKAVCEGYASLLTSLCSAIGIECKTINGFAKSFPDLHADLDLSKPNHAWNVIKLQGRWYVTDVTWAAGGYDMKKRKFFREYNEAYYLPLPERFIWSHFPVEQEWTLCDVKLTKKRFDRLPVFYSSCLRLAVSPIRGARAEIGKQLDIEIASGFPIEKAHLRYGSGLDFVVVNVEPTTQGYRLTCKVPKEANGVMVLECDGFRLIGFLKS